MIPITESNYMVRIERTLPASAHTIYRAWLEPG